MAERNLTFEEIYRLNKHFVEKLVIRSVHIEGHRVDVCQDVWKKVCESNLEGKMNLAQANAYVASVTKSQIAQYHISEGRYVDGNTLWYKVTTYFNSFKNSWLALMSNEHADLVLSSLQYASL